MAFGVDPGLAILLEKARGAELDYNFVMDCLKQYQNPRVKLHHLLKIGALIRIKKGLYVFNPKVSKYSYCVETLANMIYGPSYISLEWACEYWHLIPERVFVITNVTTKRSKEFNTPIGLFTYDHLPIKAYSMGFTYMSFSENQSALIATKEKALIDLVILRRGFSPSIKDLKETLFEDFRVEESDFFSFNRSLVEQIHHAHPHSVTKNMLQLLEKKNE